MTWVWLAAAVGFGSALIPVISIEAYLAALGGAHTQVGLLTLALSAAVGQTLGKAVLYVLAAHATDLPWLRRKTQTESWQRGYARWHARAEHHPWRTGGLVFVSAFSSLPPLYLLTVIAGQLRFGLPGFLAATFAGRWLRFVALLNGVSWLLAG